MNNTLVELTRGRSVARIAIVILGIALATAPEALAWVAGDSQGAAADITLAAEGDITRAAAGARITSAVTGLAAET